MSDIIMGLVKCVTDLVKTKKKQRDLFVSQLFWLDTGYPTLSSQEIKSSNLRGNY